MLPVCDARYNFTLIDVEQFGSNDDSGVLKESDLGRAFDGGNLNLSAPESIPGCRLKEAPYYLVGDEIFPLKDWLMRSYPGIKTGTMDEPKHIFNYRLSRDWRAIENTFGILVARWRVFRGFIRAAVENVECYVLVSLSLHNYLRQTDNAGYCPLGFVDTEDSSGYIKPG